MENYQLANHEAIVEWKDQNKWLLDKIESLQLECLRLRDEQTQLRKENMELFRRLNTVKAVTVPLVDFEGLPRLANHLGSTKIED